MGTLQESQKRLVRKRFTVDSCHHSLNNSKYDEKTGQVYTETQVSFWGSSDKDWEYRTHAMPYVDSLSTTEIQNAPKNGIKKVKQKGSRSLQLTTLDTIIANVSDLSLQSLELMPLKLVEFLWNTIVQKSCLCLHVWSIFSTTLLRRGSSTIGMLRYRETIPTPQSPLETYTQALLSKKFDFITGLTITVPVPVPELMNLTKLVNLVALEILHQGDPCRSLISDLLIKAWSISASQEASFPILRVIKLWNHREITSRSLACIDNFPALAVYEIRGCDIDDYSILAGTGWTLQDAAEPYYDLECERPRNRELVQACKEMRVENTMSTHRVMSWDYKLHKLIDQVGIIRKNFDLERVGVSPKNRVLYVNEMMSRMPLACIRLGPSNSLTPEPTKLFLKKQTSIQKENIRPKCTKMKNTDALKSKERQCTTLTKKKRKLDELLHEFS
ncbi:unnamed protein product [Blumeria hordei]|uniref:Uncharacterized protein n=1 Tax=Blumeria hordei TaxID=2867405 RepID=A0A383US44_BLUHO|nr:unnamed protein product [Blumeria hordei]